MPFLGKRALPGTVTWMVALTGAPGEASFDVTALVAVLIVPEADVAIRFTEKLHAAPGDRVPPARLITAPPAGAVIVPAPQPPLSPFGIAITKPDVTRESVKASPVSDVAGLGLVSVKISAVEPPADMVASLNAMDNLA